MINLFNRIYNWGMGLVIKYQEYKTKKFERHNCHYCGKRYLFDVPVGVPIEQIIFVCKACNPTHEKALQEEELVPQFPSDNVALNLTKEQLDNLTEALAKPTLDCVHPIRNREYYESGMFKCWECKKIINYTEK